MKRLGNDRVLGISADDYSPELSRVVRWKGEIAGMLLAENLGNRTFLYPRAVAKKHSAKYGTVKSSGAFPDWAGLDVLPLVL